MLDLPDRNLRPGVQRGRAQSSGRGNRSRRSSKAVSRSVERVGYQWKFSASYVRVSTRVNSLGKIESGHGPVSIAVITVRRQRTRSNPERRRNEEVSVQPACVHRHTYVCACLCVRASKIPLAEKLRQTKRRWRWSMRDDCMLERDEKVIVLWIGSRFVEK